MDVKPKQIYITKRGAAYSCEEWTERWRQHGRFARNLELFAQIEHYRQCRVLPRSVIEPTGFAEVAQQDEYDGVGMVWFRGEDALPAALEDPRIQELMDDELDVFEGPIADRTLFCRELVGRDTGATTVKIVAAIRHKEGTTRADFRHHWEHVHKDIFLGIPEADRLVTKYVQNHALDGYENEMDAQWDGIVEIGFARIEDIATVFGSPEYMSRVRPDEESFLDMEHMLVVLTDDVLLYHDGLGKKHHATPLG
ncbi:unannotated protein [freshwater metagenome]|uniref:Unannotated protein n=1 Tax=freshwater metagenome TaxID=449393 RepID=A0A6J7J6B2_9ZZZZ